MVAADFGNAGVFAAFGAKDLAIELHAVPPLRAETRLGSTLVMETGAKEAGQIS